MKRLNNYIYEWKANTNTMSSIEKHDIQYFVYKTNIKHNIRIFGEYWLNEYNTYKDKVYINGEHIKLDKYGYTEISFSPGKYNVYIKDINDITNCQAMFYDCEQLISVPLFDTSKVENMRSMFYDCINLSNVSLFNTSKVKNMVQMFFGCKNLENVPLFDTKNVETTHSMFQLCKNIKEVPLFNTYNVKDMSQMFHDCSQLIDVPLFDTKNVEDIYYMFLSCKNLSEQTKKEWSQIYDFEKDDKKI